MKRLLKILLSLIVGLNIAYVATAASADSNGPFGSDAGCEHHFKKYKLPSKEALETPMNESLGVIDTLTNAFIGDQKLLAILNQLRVDVKESGLELKFVRNTNAALNKWPQNEFVFPSDLLDRDELGLDFQLDFLAKVRHEVTRKKLLAALENDDSLALIPSKDEFVRIYSQKLLDVAIKAKLAELEVLSFRANSDSITKEELDLVKWYLGARKNPDTLQAGLYFHYFVKTSDLTGISRESTQFERDAATKWDQLHR